MPSPRTLNSVQSSTHGLVLWCPIDQGKIRIGYVFSMDLVEKYGEDGVTGEVAMAEAKKAVAPFSLEFEKLDWFTLYVSSHFYQSPAFLLVVLIWLSPICRVSAKLWQKSSSVVVSF